MTANLCWHQILKDFPEIDKYSWAQLTCSVKNPKFYYGEFCD